MNFQTELIQTSNFAAGAIPALTVLAFEEVFCSRFRKDQPKPPTVPLLPMFDELAQFEDRLNGHDRS